MVLDIQSKEVIDKISEELKVQPALQIPRKLADNIQLVYNVNPQRNVRPVGSLLNRTTTGSGISIVAFPIDKETYVTGVLVSNVSDVACDNTLLLVTLPMIDFTTDEVWRRHKVTLTATDTFDYLPFDNPIKVISGGVAEFSNAFSVGASTSSIIIFGYTVDKQ